jgi:nucleoid DNA-binding protein
MKKVFCILGMLVIWMSGYSQSPPNFVPRSGPAVTAQDYRLAAKLNFYLPHTHGLTLNSGLDTLGAAIYEDSSGHVWYRDTIPSGGHKWSEVLKSGDITPVIWGNITGTLSNQTDLQNALNAKLSNITNYLTAGSNVTVTGLGTLASPYVINSSASGTGTVTNFIFTNGNGITGTVTNATSTPNLSLGTSLTGIINGNGTGFSTVSIGSGLSYSGGVLSATGGTSLNGLVSANGSAFTTASIGAGLSFSGNTLTNTINNTNQLTNGAGFLTNITNFISAGTNVTITGSGTLGSPYVINSSGGGGGGTVTNFSAGTLSPLFTTSVTNPTTIPGLSFTLSNATANSVFGNNTGSSAAPVYYVPTITTLNGWASGTIALLGSTQTFTAVNTFNGGVALGNNVTFSTTNTYQIGGSSNVASHVWARVFNSDASASLSATTGNSAGLFIGANPGITLLSTGQGQLNNYITSTSFTGTPTSILEVDASGNIIQGSLFTQVAAVQGLHASVTGDSVLMGGFFYQPDTVSTLGYGFAITGLGNEATLGAGDSVLVEKAGSKYLTLVPSSAIGGGGAVSSVSDNGTGTLTISPNTGAVLAGVNQGFNFTWTGSQMWSSPPLPASDDAVDLGGGTGGHWRTGYIDNVKAHGILTLGAASGSYIAGQINGVNKFEILSTGQGQLNGYTSSSSFPVTAVGMLVFDASGNIGTQAIGGSTTLTRVTINSGTSLTGSAANTLYTINFSSTQPNFTYTLPPSPTDQQVVSFESGPTLGSGTEITSFSVLPNSGQAGIIASVPITTFAYGGIIVLRYNSSTTYWNRIQ